MGNKNSYTLGAVFTVKLPCNRIAWDIIRAFIEPDATEAGVLQQFYRKIQSVDPDTSVLVDIVVEIDCAKIFYIGRDNRPAVILSRNESASRQHGGIFFIFCPVIGILVKRGSEINTVHRRLVCIEIEFKRHHYSSGLVCMGMSELVICKPQHIGTRPLVSVELSEQQGRGAIQEFPPLRLRPYSFCRDSGRAEMVRAEMHMPGGIVTYKPGLDSEGALHHSLDKLRIAAVNHIDLVNDIHSRLVGMQSICLNDAHAILQHLLGVIGIEEALQRSCRLPGHHAAVHKARELIAEVGVIRYSSSELSILVLTPVYIIFKKRLVLLQNFKLIECPVRHTIWSGREVEFRRYLLRIIYVPVFASLDVVGIYPEQVFHITHELRKLAETSGRRRFFTNHRVGIPDLRQPVLNMFPGSLSPVLEDKFNLHPLEHRGIEIISGTGNSDVQRLVVRQNTVTQVKP